MLASSLCTLVIFLTGHQLATGFYLVELAGSPPELRSEISSNGLLQQAPSSEEQPHPTMAILMSLPPISRFFDHHRGQRQQVFRQQQAGISKDKTDGKRSNKLMDQLAMNRRAAYSSACLFKLCPGIY